MHLKDLSSVQLTKNNLENFSVPFVEKKKIWVNILVIVVFEKKCPYFNQPIYILTCAWNYRFICKDVVVLCSGSKKGTW